LKDPRIDPSEGRGVGIWVYGEDGKLLSVNGRVVSSVDEDGEITFEEELE
jgi:hypothetical protein